MLSKLKNYFFNGMFFLLYAAFAYQFVMAVSEAFGGQGYAGMGLTILPFLWLALMGARYLAKKSSGSGSNGGGHRGGHYRR